jgi:hypothetical protein
MGNVPSVPSRILTYEDPVDYLYPITRATHTQDRKMLIVTWRVTEE